MSRKARQEAYRRYKLCNKQLGRVADFSSMFNPKAFDFFYELMEKYWKLA